MSGGATSTLHEYELFNPSYHKEQTFQKSHMETSREFPP